VLLAEFNIFAASWRTDSASLPAVFEQQFAVKMTSRIAAGSVSTELSTIEVTRLLPDRIVTSYSANTLNSERAGQAAALVIRKRILFVVGG